MSFEETIANLRQNNRITTQQIKTYNLDEARFESARLQKQGELWMLAGNLGADIVKKIAANREKDAINDEYITYYENQFKEYEQSEEALAAETLFKSNANNQNILSDNLTGIENAGAPSDDVAEAKMSTGKHIRLREQLRTSNLAQRYPGWLQNQLLNNQDIFFAEIDGQQVKIQVNNPNLTFKEKIAAQKYLTKEYLKLHDIQKYSKDFLYLPTERGGSGFMKSILETNNSNTEDLRNAYKIELSEVDINLATRQLATLKNSQSFKDLLSSLNAGYDTKGNPLNYAGAWKRLNDKILPQMVDAGLLPPDKILEIGATTTINFQGKEILLKDLRPAEWSEDGKWYNSAMEVWKKKGERSQAKADFKLEGAAEEFIKNFNNDTFTSETDLIRARTVLEELNAEGSGEYDFSKIDALLDSKVTKPQADERALEILNTYNESTEGLKLSELIKSEDIRVQESPILTKALRDEDKFYKELENSLKGEKKNYASESKDVNGLSVWEYNNPSAEEKWHLIEGYAVRLKRDNPTVRNSQIWKETKNWITDNEWVSGMPSSEWEAEAKSLEGKELEEWNQNTSKLFAKDSEGYYPNMLPDVEFKGPSTISKEDKTELEAVTTIDPTFGNEVTTWVKKNPEAKFTNSNLIIPEEKAVFKNRPIDYNKMLDDIGYIPDSLVDLAAANGLTTAAFINYRQTANGKKELKPEYARFLNEMEVSTLPFAMKNRLLGNINDGQYTHEEIPASISSNSMEAGVVNKMTFGDSAEKYIFGLTESFPKLNLNDDGDFTTNDGDAKLFTGLMETIPFTISPTAYNDFKEGGSQQFIELLKATTTPTDINSLIDSSDEAGFNAYSLTGDLSTLPVVDGLKDTLGETNFLKRQKALEKYWEYIEEETTSSESEEEELINTGTSTNIIDESLDNPYNE